MARMNFRNALMVLAGLLALFAVLPLNGAPLFYVDTGGYLDQGAKALSRLFPASETPGNADMQTAPKGDGVTGNRAVVYALILAGAARMFGLGWAMLPQVAATVLTLWLVARAVWGGTGDARGQPLALPGVFGEHRRGAVWGAAVLALAGGAGSLPFFTIYLMPDIFAPLLILLAALAVAAGGHMARWERLLLVLGMAIAVMTHISHLALVLVLIPVAAVIGLLWRGHPARWYLAPLMIGLAAMAGIAERLAFQGAVERLEKTEVVYQPFLTTRLLIDGPGMTYLAQTCPSATEVACPLYELLSAPEYPERRNATNIIFEDRQSHGSLRLLPIETQKAIARDQRHFALRVLRDAPFAVTGALIRNSWAQLTRVSIWMTLPRPADLDSLEHFSGAPAPALAAGRILRRNEASWWQLITRIDRVHGVVYLLSALALAGLILRPACPPGLRVMALMVLAGIAANAVICGGLSQPAARYGGRVAWLLPMMVALLALAPRYAPASATGGQSGGP